MIRLMAVGIGGAKWIAVRGTPRYRSKLAHKLRLSVPHPGMDRGVRRKKPSRLLVRRSVRGKKFGDLRALQRINRHPIGRDVREFAPREEIHLGLAQKALERGQTTDEIAERAREYRCYSMRSPVRSWTRRSFH